MLDTTEISDVSAARAQIFGEDLKTLTPPESNKPVIDPGVLERLGRIEQTANPIPPAVTPQVTDKGLPEYLKEYEEVLKEPLKPGEDKTDYTALLKQQTGQDATLTNRDEFEDYVGRLAAKEAFFEQNGLSSLQAIVDGGMDAGTVVQQVIKNNLTRAGLYTEGQYDRMVGEFFDEGELNEKGKAKHGEIVNSAKREITDLQAKADKYADDHVAQNKAYYATLETAAKTMKVGGVELDEDMASHLVHRIRTGEVNRWLQENKTDEEAAQKELMLALVSSPNAFAHWLVKMDERTANQRVAKDVARLIS